MYLKNSTCPPWYDEIAMPCASSCDRAVDDLLDRPVVPEMDHLAARRLQDAPHDVDRRVVAVEQRRRRDEADLVDRLVDERRRLEIVHRETPRGRAARRGPGTESLLPRLVTAEAANRYMTFT